MDSPLVGSPDEVGIPRVVFLDAEGAAVIESIFPLLIGSVGKRDRSDAWYLTWIAQAELFAMVVYAVG